MATDSFEEKRFRKPEARDPKSKPDCVACELGLTIRSLAVIEATGARGSGGFSVLYSHL